MKFSDKHIRKYLRGKLSAKEEYAIEKAAHENPILSNAIDGYRENTDGLNYYNSNVRPKVLGAKILTIGAVIGITIACVFFINKENKAKIEQNTLEQNEIVSLNIIDTLSETKDEVEKMDSSILSLNPTEKEKQFNLSSIREAQQNLNPQNSSLQNSNSLDSIDITEELPFDAINLNIETEERMHSWGKGVPYAYVQDLFVVDYRKIKRENKLINYTRLELQGTSAAYENEKSSNSDDLIEVKAQISYWEYLEKAIKKLENENFKGALNQFQIILNQYPEDLNATFYSGLCYFNFGEFEKSNNLFERSMEINLNAFKEESLWFSLKCDLELGSIEKARKKLTTIIVNGGFYTEKAIELQKELN